MSGRTEAAKILVVDDEPANVRLLERWLRSTPGWETTSVTRSTEALPRFRELHPDLVLLDLHMPAPDGFVLLRAFREALPDPEYLPIVVLTADSTRESRDRALSLGASDFLIKPLDATEVLLRTRNLIETRALHRRVAEENERLEAQVRERTRALEEALEVAQAATRARDQFLANMSHELRTPLTAIRATFGLLNGPLRSELPERALPLVETAVRNSARLERLVQDTLLLQSLQSGTLEIDEVEVDVGEVVRTLTRGVTDGGDPAAVELCVSVPEGMDCLRTDGERLAEVLRRLLDNALRFTQRGAITVEVITDEDARTPAAIAVTDTGPGIDPSMHQSIFRAFEQVDEADSWKHGGLGVGLAIAQALCDRLGFALSVDSAPGRGACFRVDLRGGRREKSETEGPG